MIELEHFNSIFVLTKQKDMKTYNLSAKNLKEEIDAQEDKVFPNVLFFADESSLFWVSNEGEYIWMQDHKGINDYSNETHRIEDRRYTEKSTEGVGSYGAYWHNEEFESPFHVSEFYCRLEEINAFEEFNAHEQK